MAQKTIIRRRLQLDGVAKAIQLLATDPSSPDEGDLWYNTTSDEVKYYDGAAVQTLSAAGGAAYDPAAVAITGGTINGVTIGATDAAPGTFTAVNATNVTATSISGTSVSGASHTPTNLTVSGTSQHNGITNVADLNATGKINIAPNAGGVSANGDINYSSTNNRLEARVNGATKTLAHTDELAYPKNYMASQVPTFTSVTADRANQIDIADGIECLADDGSTLISTTSDLSAVLTTSGAGGLDTSTVAANTWYYPWVIADSSGTNPVTLLWSVQRKGSGTDPTLPSGYDLKRALPLALYTGVSTLSYPIYVAGGWPFNPEVRYAKTLDGNDHTRILFGGAATDLTAVSAANAVPPNCNLAEFFAKASEVSTTNETIKVYSVLPNTATTGAMAWFANLQGSGVNARSEAFFKAYTNDSQQIKYEWDGSSTNGQLELRVAAFTLDMQEVT